MNIRHAVILTLSAYAIFFGPDAEINAQSSAVELDRAKTTVENIRSGHAADSRQDIFDIKVYTDGDGLLVVDGKISDRGTAEALADALAEARIDCENRIEVLPDSLWALVSIPVASLRTAPRHAAEMATQAVMGTPLRLLEKGGGWWRVQCPDGYIAYVPESSLAEKSPEAMDAWRSGARFIVSATWPLRAFRTAEASGPRDVVTDLVLGSIVEVEGGAPSMTDGRLHIVLPDGRTAYAEASAFTSVDEWAAQNFDAGRILDIACSMEGIPYLWGGMSTKATDCSGLSKTAYFANGIILMRDASQQALTGGRIDSKEWRRCRAGDLVFFGNKSTGKVTHVGIYDNNGHIIHSSGRVKRNSIDPDAPDYLDGYHFLHATRIDGHEKSPGITRARNHPWYFSNK